MTEKTTIPIPKPRTSRAQFMGVADLGAEPVAENMLEDNTATRSADLNFKVSEEFHRAFKLLALHMGVSMKGLLDEAFALYVAKNGVADVVRDARAGVLQTRQRGRLEKAAEKQREQRLARRAVLAEKRERKKAEQFPG